MKNVKNRFGEGTLYEAEDLGNSIFCVCTACMSVWSDFLSWSETQTDRRITNHFESDTDTIVVLGCQVTDLAIYNDLRTAEELHKKHTDISIYMGGCLAQRFDIELPDYVRRLDVCRAEYIEITNTNRILYKKPFWNPDLKDKADDMETGNLFRNMYPLKIGAGCHGKCKYCTIRDTRGESYETESVKQREEFAKHAYEGVVLISDSPTPKQICEWCDIALAENKPISFRNIEPQNVNACKEKLLTLASAGLLPILHSPIQSANEEVLKAMNRNVPETMKFIAFAQELRKMGTQVATNIIIDYKIGDKIWHNMDEEWLDTHFDYWSWNPYFDGNWDYNTAEERFSRYIGEWR